MMIILSPAKTFQRTRRMHRQLPFFADEARELYTKIRGKTLDEIEQAMNVSKKIARDVFEYAQTYGQNIQPAIHTYYGAAYKAFHAASLSENDLFYAENHIRILSALYGILKPLDGISFYRLDYKDRMLGNLYDFWRPRVSEYVCENLKDQVIVNLASQEFSSVLSNFDMFTIAFKSFYKDKLRTTSMESKRMRGAFARMIVEKRIEDVRLLKEIVIDGYRYSKTHSDDREYVFIKDGD